jgi:hypothetical protein
MDPLRAHEKGRNRIVFRVVGLIGYTMKIACLIAVVPFALGLATILTVMASKKKRDKSPPPHIYCPICLGDGEQPVLAMLRIRLVRAGAGSIDINGEERLQISYHLDCERPGCAWKEVYSFEQFGDLVARWKVWRRKATERGEWVPDDEA